MSNGIHGLQLIPDADGRLTFPNYWNHTFRRSIAIIIITSYFLKQACLIVTIYSDATQARTNSTSKSVSKHKTSCTIVTTSSLDPNLMELGVAVRAPLAPLRISGKRGRRSESFIEVILSLLKVGSARLLGVGTGDALSGAPSGYHRLLVVRKRGYV